MLSQKNKAFTLIEMIVVVTLLAILWTLAFFAATAEIKSARNSKRVTDMANIVKWVELYKEKVTIYPQPSNFKQVYYHSLPLWKEGEVTKTDTFSDVFINNSQTLKDPFYDIAYPYSVTQWGIEFQIGTTLEQEIPIAYVEGTYNGKIISSHTGSTFYLYPTPSILSSMKYDVDLWDMMSHSSLVFNGSTNLPASYNKYGSGGFLFNPKSNFVYSWSIDSFKTISNKKLIGQNIQNAYSGTVLDRTVDFEKFMGIDFSQDSSTIYVTWLLRQSIGTDF